MCNIKLSFKRHNLLGSIVKNCKSINTMNCIKESNGIEVMWKWMFSSDEKVTEQHENGTITINNERFKQIVDKLVFCSTDSTELNANECTIRSNRKQKRNIRFNAREANSQMYIWNQSNTCAHGAKRKMK